MATKDLKSDLMKTVALGGGVALATAGLTTCDFGAVDPAPPPLDCKADMGGLKLRVTGDISVDVLTVKIAPESGFGSWQTAQITAVQGATLLEIDSKTEFSTVIARFKVPIGGGDGGAPDGGTGIAGSFTLDGTITGTQGSACTVHRVFQFTVENGVFSTQMMASRARLPLELRDAASIALVTRQEGEVLLQARSRHTGERRLTWSVTGGDTSESGDLLRWRLPAEPGLYQVELVVDRGPAGLSIDTLTLEVG